MHSCQQPCRVQHTKPRVSCVLVHRLRLVQATLPCSGNKNVVYPKQLLSMEQRQCVGVQNRCQAEHERTVSRQQGNLQGLRTLHEPSPKDAGGGRAVC